MESNYIKVIPRDLDGITEKSDDKDLIAIIKEFDVRKGYSWAEQISNYRWINIENILSKNSINKLENILELFKSGLIVKLPLNFLRIFFKYLVNKQSSEIIDKTFEFISANYDVNLVRQELLSLTFIYELKYPEEKKNSYYLNQKWKNELSPKYIFDIFITQENERINKIKEHERKHNEICKPSYYKYFEEFKELYGYTYASPNRNKDSSEYGVLIDEILSTFLANDIDFDIKYPKAVEIFTSIKKKSICDSIGKGVGYEKTYFPSQKIKLSPILNGILTDELRDLFLELSIKCEIKRFFLIGGIDIEFLLLDYVHLHGFDFLQKHMSEKKWQEYISWLSNYEQKVYNDFRDDMGFDFSVHWKKSYIGKCLLNDGVTIPERWLLGLVRKDYNTIFPHGEILTTTISWSNWDNLQIGDFIQNKENYYEYLKSFAEPENEIRTRLGLPKIGEGWISETKLYYLVKERLNEYIVIQHGKPKWLGKQHLDIYIPELNIGVEYQGKQHDLAIDFFGGEDSLASNKERDRRKKIFCDENNCQLFYVYPEDDFSEFLEKLVIFIKKPII